MPAAGARVCSDSVASSADHPAYRRDIDGLRAVAVLSVIGFHAFASSVPGGFVGVDIFFVISGYLITTIILGDLRRDAFSYRTFYTRRIKRIFPALILVLGTVWAIGWFRLFPDEYRQLGKHIAAGSGFVSNVVLRGESGYFDNAAETKPLLHLWSLAIEEQFYIFWPLILAFTARRLASIGTIVAIAVASFAFNLATMDMQPVLAFYSPFSRFWELMIGGVLAHALQARPSWFERHREWRSMTGFALIVLAVALFWRWGPYPGWRALLPTVGTFLIISAGPDATLNRLLLSNRGAVAIGKISYPLYLWHWPLLSFVYIAQSDAASPWMLTAAIAVAFVLATLTYRFVEQPIRRSTNKGAMPLALVATLVFAGSVGFVTLDHEGFMERFGERGKYSALFDEATPEMRYRTRNNLFAAFREECNFYDNESWRLGHSTNRPLPEISPTCYARPPGTRQAVFLWGDSHAEHLNAGIREALPADVAVLQVASSGCAADLVEPDQPARSFCRKSNQFALAAIRSEKPEIVLIAQREGHDLERFRTIAKALKRSGVREVLVLGPIPQWKPDLNKVIASHYWDRTPDRLIKYLDPATVRLNEKLGTNRRPEEPFVYIDLFEFLCNERGCRTYLDGDRTDGLMTFDYGHLTPRAASFLGRTLLGPMLIGLLGTPAPTTREAPVPPDSVPLK